MIKKTIIKKTLLFLYPLRCLIVGSSVRGKTTLLLNFVYKNWIPYTNVYVFSKSLEQNRPTYNKLQGRYQNVEKSDYLTDILLLCYCEDLIVKLMNVIKIR